MFPLSLVCPVDYAAQHLGTQKKTDIPCEFDLVLARSHSTDSFYRGPPFKEEVRATPFTYYLTCLDTIETFAPGYVKKI